MELGDFDGLAALHDAQVRELFLAAAGVVFERGVVFDDAADDFEEADAAGEGIGHGFEDDGGGGLAVVDFARDGRCRRRASAATACAARLDGDGCALSRRGRVDLEEVEQMIEGHVGEAA